MDSLAQPILPPVGKLDTPPSRAGESVHSIWKCACKEIFPTKEKALKHIFGKIATEAYLEEITDVEWVDE